MSKAAASSNVLKLISRQSLCATAIRLLLSGLIACLFSLLVFKIWFPSPFFDLMGGDKLFWIIVGVDVVLGPLLTLIISSPKKNPPELFRDLTVIALIQIAALIYGVHILSYTRPIALVFEVDRFRAISYVDIDEKEASKAPEWVAPWSLEEFHVVATREPRTSEERLASIEASIQGIEPGQRPSWWQDYSLSSAQVLKRSHSMEDLISKYPSRAKQIATAFSRATSSTRDTTIPELLRWLPLVSRRTSNWIALIDPQSARVCGYANFDGFK